MFLGDVTGKGIEAAADMAMAKFSFRALARKWPDPSPFLANANEVIVDEIGAGKFITMLYLLVDPLERKIARASAGHPAPRIISPGGKVLRSTPEGLRWGSSRTRSTRPRRSSSRPVPPSSCTRTASSRRAATASCTARSDWTSSASTASSMHRRSRRRSSSTAAHSRAASSTTTARSSSQAGGDRVGHAPRWTRLSLPRLRRPRSSVADGSAWSSSRREQERSRPRSRRRGCSRPTSGARRSVANIIAHPRLFVARLRLGGKVVDRWPNPRLLGLIVIVGAHDRPDAVRRARFSTGPCAGSMPCPSVPRWILLRGARPLRHPGDARRRRALCDPARAERRGRGGHCRRPAVRPLHGRKHRGDVPLRHRDDPAHRHAEDDARAAALSSSQARCCSARSGSF